MLSFSKIVVVKLLDTASNSGSALLTAINNISDASASNRYAIMLDAGIYDIGDNSIILKI
ncbi:MAG: hypothetical protein IT292_00870 [Deltaproteobacteria bacterium]|nr:hypothetical protein [Deltaproteobacteria bacterium]